VNVMHNMTHEETAPAPRMFVIGASIATLISIAAWLLAPIEARFISSLTDNPTLVGVTYAVGAVAYSILALILGRVADRVGREKMIIMGLVVGVIYPILYASAINVFTYMGIELLWALAAVGTGPILYAFLQDLIHEHPNRGHLMSLMWGAMSLSGAVGHLTGGFVASSFGLTGPYYVVSGIFFLILLGSLPVFLKSARQAPCVQRTEQEDHGLDTSSVWFGMRYVFTKPALVYYFIVNSAVAICYRVKLLVWPLIVVLFIEDPAVMGIIFAGTGVTAFFVLMFSGKFVDRYGPYPGVTLAFVAFFMGGFLMAFTGSYWWFGVGAALFAVGEAFWGSAQSLLLIDNVASQHRAEVLGVDMIFDSSFTTAGMLGAGALMAVWSAQEVWLVLMLVLLVAYILATIYKMLRIPQSLQRP